MQESKDDAGVAKVSIEQVSVSHGAARFDVPHPRELTTGSRPASPVTPLIPALPRARKGGRALAASRWFVGLLAFALVCAWLLPGTLGHDPWKQDETYTFGIIEHMLDTGDLVVPTNAGQPFVEKPPIYDWVAASLAWMFGRSLPLHDAARLASVAFAALTLACTARLAWRATGAVRWSDPRVAGTLALFASTLVVVKHVHDMMTDVALMAGAALAFGALYELVCAHLRMGGGLRRSPDGDCNTGPAWPESPPSQHASSDCEDSRIQGRAARHAAAMFGVGVGIAFLAKGLFVPLVFGATTCAAMLLYPACRSSRFARSLARSALYFAPFALIWPLCLYLRSETLFRIWLWDNNIGRFFGFSVAQLGSENVGHLFVLRTALTVGFPVVPLALVALAGGAWRRLREPEVALPVLFSGIGFAVLQASATVRELYILPFIAPLSLLAMQGVRYLPQRVHLVWDMTSRIVFGAFVVLAWFVWWTMTASPDTHGALHLLGRWLPLDWVMPIQPKLIIAALALTLGWGLLLPRLKSAGNWRGVFSWCLGAIVTWGLVSTLLLPWLDVAKSYRAPFEDLRATLNGAWKAGDCMASNGLGESEAPMLYYFAGVMHEPTADPQATSCNWLIEQGRPAQGQPPAGGWRLYWEGSRPGDNDEVLRVYQRMAATTSS
ncbi:ArnT family glycosyltransferase [Paraburkholderia sp. EG287A]|uniref:ArnT family glycosyltransferase n=1 Tax=unclassified Paraburkholderia TaxID=2615204 RepID=UPI0034D196CA